MLIVTNSPSHAARFAFATIAGTTIGQLVHPSLPGKLTGMPFLVSSIALGRRS